VFVVTVGNPPLNLVEIDPIVIFFLSSDETFFGCIAGNVDVRPLLCKIFVKMSAIELDQNIRFIVWGNDRMPGCEKFLASRSYKLTERTVSLSNIAERSKAPFEVSLSSVEVG
jgi:hypothetical protein